MNFESGGVWFLLILIESRPTQVNQGQVLLFVNHFKSFLS
ncbi:hypothetical protein PMAG_a4035 [Pseudoalteromonas mariniglutinosa NCIMB 1770]|nr:hypothetical protein [Pseudoalteromonas mariniglutinosa NCIMB 1770]